MSNIKHSFVLYNDYIDTTDELSDEEAGKLFKMILAKVNGRELECDDKLLRLVFKPIEKSLDRDLKKYENKLQEKSQAGKTGNLKRWNPDLYEQFQKGKIDLKEALKIAESRKTSQSDKSIAKIAVSVNDSDSDTENVNVNENGGVDDKKLLSLNDAAHFFYKDEKVVMAIYKDKKLQVDTKKSLIANLKNFILHLEQKKVSEKTLKDFREHFISWLRKKEEGNKSGKAGIKVGGFSSEDVDRMYKANPNF